MTFSDCVKYMLIIENSLSFKNSRNYFYTFNECALSTGIRKKENRIRINFPDL